MNDVVVLSVFTTDVRNHRDINETCREILGSNFPTRTMVQVVAPWRAPSCCSKSTPPR